MLYYAGVGSRQTPPAMMDFMTRIAQRLDANGYTLRSGGANGADTAFERGAQSKVIYLPWPYFNGNDSVRFGATKAAYEIAEEFHPAWDRLSDAARKLMARNTHQVLGDDVLDSRQYSRFVLCWTPHGSGSGGTGQAIRIAKAYQIPVFDLGSPSGWAEFKVFMKPSERDTH